MKDIFSPNPPGMQDPAIETKVFDTTTTTAITTVINTGLLVNLSAIPQGVTQGQRVGDSVDLEGIELRLSANGNASGMTLRAILFQSLEPSGSVTAGTILAALSNVTAPLSAYNFTGVRQEDFKILHDSLHFLGPLTGPSDQQILHVRQKLRSRIQFDAGASSGTGLLFMLLVSDQPTTGPILTYAVRVAYADA
jgi:hypothetical protein